MDLDDNLNEIFHQVFIIQKKKKSSIQGKIVWNQRDQDISQSKKQLKGKSQTTKGSSSRVKWFIGQVDLQQLNFKQMEKDILNRKYKKITFEERCRIIELVCEQNKTCASVAKQLDYSPSTVKMIVKKYKEEGKIFQKKTDKERRQLVEELQRKHHDKTTSGSQINYEPMPMYFYMPNFTNQMLYNSPTMMYYPPF